MLMLFLIQTTKVAWLVELMLIVHGKQLRLDGQLSHCSWASLLEAGNQYLVHILSPLTDKMLFLNQRKIKNGRRNIFMTKSS